MLTLEVQDGTIFIFKNDEILLEFVPHDKFNHEQDALIEVMNMVDARNAELMNGAIDAGAPLDTEITGKLLQFSDGTED